MGSATFKLSGQLSRESCRGVSVSKGVSVSRGSNIRDRGTCTAGLTDAAAVNM